MRLHKTKVNNKLAGPSASKQTTWEAVVTDARMEAKVALARAERLEGIARFCERMAAAGQPFPVDEKGATPLLATASSEE